MQVNSFSQPDTTYNVTIKDRRAIDCDCPSHYHGKKRNPFHICKHMRFVTQQYREAECDANWQAFQTRLENERTCACDACLADQHSMQKSEEEKRQMAPLNESNKGFSLL